MLDIDNLPEKCEICNSFFEDYKYYFLYTSEGNYIEHGNYYSNILVCSSCNYGFNSVQIFLNFKDPHNTYFIYNQDNITEIQISKMPGWTSLNKNIFPISLEKLNKICSTVKILS